MHLVVSLYPSPSCAGRVEQDLVAPIHDRENETARPLPVPGYDLEHRVPRWNYDGKLANIWECAGAG